MSNPSSVIGAQFLRWNFSGSSWIGQGIISPGDPMIIVRKLTKEVVEEAIEVSAEDNGYYLKFYAAHFDIKTLNVLKDRKVARSKLLDELLEKGKSIDIENYDLIDFNINND